MNLFRRRSASRARRQSTFLLALAALLLSPSGTLRAQSSLSLGIADKILTVSGVTPGATVALFGVTHDTEDFHARYATALDALVDDDFDGSVEISNKLITQKAAVWIAVDLASGTFGTTTGDVDFQPSAIPAPSLSLNAQGTAAVGLHLEARESVEALLVRPGQGYWSIDAVDGVAGEPQADPDGNLDLQFSLLMDPSEQVNAPQALGGSDIVVVIDSRNLEWAVISASSLGLPEAE